jgi:hypothetical protein
MVKKVAPEAAVVEEKAKPRGRPQKLITNERDKLTRAKAIRLQCIECMGYQPAFIKDCPDVPCPLWSFRMGTGFEHTDIKIRTKNG